MTKWKMHLIITEEKMLNVENNNNKSSNINNMSNISNKNLDLLIQIQIKNCNNLTNYNTNI